MAVLHGLFNLMPALIESGDEVIIPAPYWLLSRHGKTSWWRADNCPDECLPTDYKITPDQLRAATGANTRHLFSTPQVLSIRPRGCSSAQVVVEQDLLVVSDEIYAKIVHAMALNTSVLVCWVKENLNAQQWLCQSLLNDWLAWLGYLAVQLIRLKLAPSAT